VSKKKYLIKDKLYDEVYKGFYVLSRTLFLTDYVWLLTMQGYLIQKLWMY